MKVTPIEIRQKDFNKVFRGYDKEEVDAFLKSLSQEWEKLLDENREVKKRLELAEREVARLREVESSLFKTIKNAEDTGANLIEHAQRQSDLHMREAQMNAEAIMSEARTRARKTIEEAEMEAKTLVGNLLDEVSALQKEYADIEFKKQHAIQEIQALGEGLLDRVQREKTKPGRAETEQRIEKVVEAAKAINTEVKKDFSGHELKTIIQPAIATADQEKKEVPQDLFTSVEKKNAEKIAEPIVESVKAPSEPIAPATGSTKKTELPAEKTFSKSPVKEEPKDGSGSFFDTI